VSLYNALNPVAMFTCCLSTPPAQIYFPMHQYMIEGRQFTTTCVVQQNSVPEPQKVLFQRGSLVVNNNSSGVTISSHTNGTHLFTTMTVASATRSDAGELKCVVVSASSENYFQSSIIHFSVGECLLNF